MQDPCDELLPVLVGLLIFCLLLFLPFLTQCQVLLPEHGDLQATGEYV